MIYTAMIIILFLTTLLSSWSILLSSMEPRSTFLRYSNNNWRSFVSRHVWLVEKEDIKDMRNKPCRAGQLVTSVGGNLNETHVDDDVVTFVLLSQTDPQVCIVHESHVLLQHLPRSGDRVSPALSLADGDAARWPCPLTGVGAEFFCRMSTTRWKLRGDLFLVMPSQFRLVKRASTSSHAFSFALAANAVAKYCFSDIWGRSKVMAVRNSRRSFRHKTVLTLKVCRMFSGLL